MAKSGEKQGPVFEVLSITELHQRFSIDRSTVRDRLAKAGIEPLVRGVKKVQYELTPEVEELLAVDPDLEAEKLRKMRAEADIKEAQARKLHDELVEKSEVQDYVGRLFGGVHKEIAIRFPRRFAARLAKAKTAKDVTKLLTTELDRVFTDVRNNHQRFLASE